MHWIEPYKFCTRFCEVPYGEPEYYPDAEKEALAEIEKPQSPSGAFEE